MKVLEAVQTKTIPLSLIDRRYGTVYSLLSLCHDKLGEPKLAMDYLDKGLSVDPDDAFLLLWRGICRYGIDPNAIEDFKRIVRTGSKNVWPHYFLAHHAIVNGQYQECLEVCDRALQLDRARCRQGRPQRMARDRSREHWFPETVRSVGVRGGDSHCQRILIQFGETSKSGKPKQMPRRADRGNGRCPASRLFKKWFAANCPPLAA